MDGWMDGWSMRYIQILPEDKFDPSKRLPLPLLDKIIPIILNLSRLKRVIHRALTKPGVAAKRAVFAR
jgi:hypothetical protein